MIKKYILIKYGTTLFQMSGNILTVQMQGDDLVMWLDSDGYYKYNSIVSIFTGDTAPLDHRYIGTVQDKSLVYHVYAS
jgi:hypothetical protein